MNVSKAYLFFQLNVIFLLKGAKENLKQTCVTSPDKKSNYNTTTWAQ